jgi:hypothetical protein
MYAQRCTTVACWDLLTYRMNNGINWQEFALAPARASAKSVVTADPIPPAHSRAPRTRTRWRTFAQRTSSRGTGHPSVFFEPRVYQVAGDDWRAPPRSAANAFYQEMAEGTMGWGACAEAGGRAVNNENMSPNENPNVNARSARGAGGTCAVPRTSFFSFTRNRIRSGFGRKRSRTVVPSAPSRGLSSVLKSVSARVRTCLVGWHLARIGSATDCRLLSGQSSNQPSRDRELRQVQVNPVD